MGKKLKKLMCLVTGAILTAGLFAGCGSSATSSDTSEKKGGEPVKVSLWHGWNGAEEEALGEVIKKFEEKNKDVKVETLPVAFDKLNEKLKASLSTDQAPDLFIGPNDWVGTFAALNQLEEVDNYISDSKSDYLEKALKAGQYGGKQYGIPESVKTYVLIYNKDLVPNPPKTIEEMRKIAKENTKDGKYGLIFDIGNFYYDYAFFAAYGGKIFADDKGTLAFQQPELVKSLKLLNQIKNVDKVTVKDFDYNVMMDLMQTGKCAMMINGSWSFGDLDKAVKEGKGLKNWGAVTLPVLEEGKPLKPFMGTEMMYVSKNSKNKEAGAKFAKFMTSPEAQKIMNEKSGQVPINKKVETNSDWKVKVILDQVKEAELMPVIPEMGQVWTPVGDMYGKVLSGSSTPEKAVKEARTKIEKEIKSMHGE
ncbi:extracellular solute-binding protein [Haloimpatiens sp. FM7330]|uniref:sugar ABC transporter substrate-binding protein n=1 Tax=Haloimpatiens sp. FM7330 TaxID=3298610 RepID=UPI00363C1F43